MMRCDGYFGLSVLFRPKLTQSVNHTSTSTNTSKSTNQKSKAEPNRAKEKPIPKPIPEPETNGNHTGGGTTPSERREESKTKQIRSEQSEQTPHFFPPADGIASKRKIIVLLGASERTKSVMATEETAGCSLETAVGESDDVGEGAGAVVSVSAAAAPAPAGDEAAVAATATATATAAAAAAAGPEDGTSSASAPLRPDPGTDWSQSTKIPRKKRRLEAMKDKHRRYFHGGDNENENDNDGECSENNDDDNNVSLARLKREVLGRDLRVDDDHCDGGDGEDLELRQIRSLMQACASPAALETKVGESGSERNQRGEPPGITSAGNDNGNDGNGQRENAPNPNSSASASASASTNSSLFYRPPEQLRRELLCAVCHEVVYPPIALPCGHSFCGPCIEWWFDRDPEKRCPTCRKRLPRTVAPLPNLALKACVVALFGKEVVERIRQRSKQQREAARGERGGAHEAGYQVLSDLSDETWHYLRIGRAGSNGHYSGRNNPTVQVRRSIVLDAEDQRMQLALAVYGRPALEEAGLGLEVCLLSMEEDEATDQGFPTCVLSPEDELFVCDRGGRFGHTSLGVRARDEAGGLSPLALLVADPGTGRFGYAPRPRVGTEEPPRGLLFEHPETGTRLELDLAQLQNRAGGSTLLAPGRGPAEGFPDRGSRNPTMGAYDESEDDHDERMDRFEEDGFLVGDGEEEEQDEDEEDEDDVCCVCDDGGELMYCDGGDAHPGCGKSFHASCVGRSVVPEGDWICSCCADRAGLGDGGTAGHEFPVVEESEKEGTLPAPSSTGSSETSDIEGAFSGDEEGGGAHADRAGGEGLSHGRTGGPPGSEWEKTKEEEPNGGKGGGTGTDSPTGREEGGSEPEEQSGEEIDGENTPLAKRSGNGTSGGNAKRRFILDDSDSDSD